jgi:glycerate-2-kinase
LHHLLIASNQTAVEAAAAKARELGYHVALAESDQPGLAAEAGTRLAETLQQLARTGTPECLISGGETTVQLAPGVATRKGGRNQELALAAALALLPKPINEALALASGGTDGEDGPTDAAGAVVDAEVLRDIHARQMNLRSFLDRNDSYPCFDQLQALIKTGPTHTNVMDLRVGVVGTL